MRVLRLCSVYGAAGSTPARAASFDAVGGMQVHTSRLTSELDARGVEQVVVTAYRPGAPRIEHLSTRSRVIRTGVPIRRLRQLYGIGASVQVARVGRVDLVHAHLGEDLAIIPLARRASRVASALAVTVHCSLQHTLGVHDARSAVLHRLGGPMQQRLLQEADLVLVLNEGLARRLVASGIPPKRVRELPLGIDLLDRVEERPPAMDARRWVVFAGRLVPEKGVRELLEAFERVSKGDVGLLLVGDGPERRSLEAAARERRITHRVRFVGAVPHREVAGYLQHADLVVVPSWFEERGRAVLEAMAVGTPVVATNVGGIHASVRDGYNGLLVPPRDPSKLARAMDRLLGHRALAASMGSAGQTTAAEHGMTALVDETLAGYQSILERSGTRDRELAL
jgi:glycogen(starch) synthase